MHSAHCPFTIARLQTQQNRSSQNFTFFLQFGHFGSAPRRASQQTTNISSVSANNPESLRHSLCTTGPPGTAFLLINVTAFGKAVIRPHFE